MTNGQELAVVNRQAVAVRQDVGMVSSMPEMLKVAEIFAASGLFNDVRDVAKAFVKIQAGRELGIPPFAAMRGIAIIQGAPAMGATLVAGRMKAHGYDWEEIRRDNEVCELKVIKPSGKTAGFAKFTLEDAKTAGLAGKDNWRKYPKSMLFARCITDAARTFAPEVFSGIPVYTAEELGAERTDEDGAVLPPTREQVLAEKLEEAKHEQASTKQFELGKMIKAITGMKALVGPEFYYEVLAGYSFLHANEIRSRETGKKIYKILEAEAQRRKLEVTEADAPQEEPDAAAE